MTYGDIRCALILNLRKLIQNTLWAKDFSVERKQTLVAELHNTYGSNEFRCRRNAVYISHFCLTLHLLVSPTKSLAINKVLVLHYSKRGSADIVTSHPASDVFLHTLHRRQIRVVVIYRIIKTISDILFLNDNNLLALGATSVDKYHHADKQHRKYQKYSSSH